MRKVDSLLGEQKKKLLRRVTMSVQHQVNLHVLLPGFLRPQSVRSDRLWLVEGCETNRDCRELYSCLLIAFCFPLSRRLYIYSPKWWQTPWNLELSKFTWVGRGTTAKPSTGSRGVSLSNRSERTPFHRVILPNEYQHDNCYWQDSSSPTVKQYRGLPDDQDSYDSSLFRVLWLFTWNIYLLFILSSLFCRVWAICGVNWHDAI